jgi:hypothetical protein
MLHRVEDVHTLGPHTSNRAAAIRRYESELAATMASASMMGGYIGYSVQKTADEKCVLEWKAQGFQLVQ